MTHNAGSETRDKKHLDQKPFQCSEKLIPHGTQQTNKTKQETTYKHIKDY